MKMIKYYLSKTWFYIRHFFYNNIAISNVIALLLVVWAITIAAKLLAATYWLPPVIITIVICEIAIIAYTICLCDSDVKSINLATKRDEINKELEERKKQL